MEDRQWTAVVAAFMSAAFCPRLAGEDESDEQGFILVYIQLVRALDTLVTNRWRSSSNSSNKDVNEKSTLKALFMIRYRPAASAWR